MVILVSGSRSITNYELFCKLIQQTGWEISTIIHGGANGVDSLAARYAKENNIKEICMPADWSLGKMAGPVRNQEMVNLTVKLNGKVFILHDSVSRGTINAKELAEAAGLEVYYCVKKPTEVFTMANLKDLEGKLENAKLINADVARRLVKQLIQTKNEYSQVAADVKIMYKAAKELERLGDLTEVGFYNTVEIAKQALNTPTEIGRAHV